MSKKFTVGLDLGGTNTKVALLKDTKNIIDKTVFSTRKFKKKSELLKKIITAINDILTRNNIRERDVIGLGVGVAGPVNFEEGLIYNLVNIKGWHNVYLKKILEEKLKIKTYLDNDVNLVALAEHKFGAGIKTRNMIAITLGTGVGAGIILEGRLYRGSDFVAGEVGHIPVNIEGPKCNCGGYACLERYVGNRYIVKRAEELLKKDKNSKLSELAYGKTLKITPEVISKAAKLKDKIAIKVWQETGVYIGVALSGLVNVLNPERIVIGGGISLAGKILFDSIRDTVTKRAMKTATKNLKIVPAKLGEDAGIIGASALIVTSRK